MVWEAIPFHLTASDVSREMLAGEGDMGGGEVDGGSLEDDQAAVVAGAGAEVINVPAPGPFRESVRNAEQNLISRSQELGGDRDPRQHEFSIQLRACDGSRSGSDVGAVNPGGSLDPVYNAVSVAELAVEKGAQVLLIPVSARRQLIDLSDDMATRVAILFYADALLKALDD